MKTFVIVVAGLGAALAACAPTGPSRESLVYEPSNCSARRFDVYFADGQARLTPPARQAIGLAAGQLQGCEIARVQVLGLADASGGSAANLSLSERRAAAVVEALKAVGLPAPAFDVAAAGDAGAVAADGAQEPLRRRTEILIEARPR